MLSIITVTRMEDLTEWQVSADALVDCSRSSDGTYTRIATRGARMNVIETPYEIEEKSDEARRRAC